MDGLGNLEIQNINVKIATKILKLDSKELFKELFKVAP